MTKRELVIGVAESSGFTQHEVAAIVQATLDTIIDTLANDDRLEIRNFGVFEVKLRESRIGRNPRTGEEVPIGEKRVATFKPGKALKERVMNSHLHLEATVEARATQGEALPDGSLDQGDNTSGVSTASTAEAPSEPSVAGEQSHLF